MATNSEVCRTCLTLISNNEARYNIDDDNKHIKNIRNIREMIMMCVPEMDLFVTNSSSICDSCLKLLISLYNFKTRCLRVERAIQNYTSKTHITGNIDLYDVVRHQMQDALLQKKWSPQQIQEYLDEVNWSLANKTKFSPPMQNMPYPLPLGHVSASLPNVSEMQIENPLLNRILDRSHPNERPRISVVPHAHLKEPPATTTKKYISVRKNLMPEVPTVPMLQPPMPNSAMNLSYRGVSYPPPVVINRPPTGPFQNAFLNTINLSERNANNSYINVPNMRIPNCAEALRAVRIQRPMFHPLNAGFNNVYLNRPPMSSNAALGVPPKDNEVLIMNMLDENIQSTSQPQVLDSTAIYTNNTKPVENAKPPSVKLIINLPPIKKDILKRKLTPEQVIEEILSKRRRLVVKVSRNVPHLLCNKKLFVNVKNEKYYKCRYCDAASIKPEGLKPHYFNCHRVCKICGFTCDFKVDIDRHIDTEHPTELRNAVAAIDRPTFEFRCFLCPYEGKSLHDLKEHRLELHIKKDDYTGLYRCPFEDCQNVSGSSVSTMLHIETKHDYVIRRQCALCNHRAKRPYYIRHHVSTHFTTDQVTCEFCGGSYKSKINLRGHIRRRHKNNLEGEIPGLLFNPLGGSFGLIADEDGRITLSSAEPQTGFNVASDQNDSADGPDLMDFLCQQYIEIPSDDDDCTIVNNDVEKNNSNNTLKQSTIEIGQDPKSTGDLEELLDEHISTTSGKEVSDKDILQSKVSDTLGSESANNIDTVEKTAIPLEELLDQHFSETSALENVPVDPLIERNEVSEPNIEGDLETMLDEHSYSTNNDLILIDSSDDEDINITVPLAAVIPKSNKGPELDSITGITPADNSAQNELSSLSDDFNAKHLEEILNNVPNNANMNNAKETMEISEDLSELGYVVDQVINITDDSPFEETSKEKEGAELVNENTKGPSAMEIQLTSEKSSVDLESIVQKTTTDDQTVITEKVDGVNANSEEKRSISDVSTLKNDEKQPEEANALSCMLTKPIVESDEQSDITTANITNVPEEGTLPKEGTAPEERTIKVTSSNESTLTKGLSTEGSALIGDQTPAILNNEAVAVTVNK